MALTPTEILEQFQNIGSIIDSDCILLHQAASNTTKKITAELLRAYLNAGFSLSVNEQGYLVIGGEVTDKRIVGTDIRLGVDGLEISHDGHTYEPLISYTGFLERAIVFCTEAQYEDWLENNLIDDNKIYMTYEEE